MIVIKRRLIFWLMKAYIKRWWKAIIVSFVAGLAIFFLLEIFLFRFLVQLVMSKQNTIGVVGAYTVDTIPVHILSQVGRGLTKVDEHGNILPDIADSWSVRDGGKTYQVTLKKNEYFSDGTLLTAKTLPLMFSDVIIDRPSTYTVVFHLKEPYAPFLITLSKPLFRDNFVGIGNYRITHIQFNGSFIENITLSFRARTGTTETFQFYPTEDALKIAFALGEVTVADGLTTPAFQNTVFTTFPNVIVTKTTDYTRLVTLFYNTQDSLLSSKQVRDALSYAFPNTFPQGERSFGPFPPQSWDYDITTPHTQDIAHANLLLKAAGNPKIPTLVITTEPQYEQIAKQIQSSWKILGISSKIVMTYDIPSTFQMYLGDFTVPKDPDQYTLWHSFQSNNITRFNNPRIDKDLEDGRKTIDKNQRLLTYQDFQKYLEDEQPATFLYFPYSYTITRR
ncbi:MAG TPA: ABC transporter substrate-binding protein [Patescibacteria group bacterium]|nr:ABC transporter substrate-binding protein [Patescibacteria group bacterium]